MKHFSVARARFWLILVVVIVATCSFAAWAYAQCSFPACDRPGERFNAATRNCESGPDPFTLARSHRVPTCRDGERLDRATGRCVLDACDEGCEARALCGAKERYSRSGRDRDGVYGVCERGPSGFGRYRSHRLVRCPAGFTLNEARGVCVGNCPAATTRRPDLVVRRTFLRGRTGGAPLTSVRAGEAYYACFEVANVGHGPSGPFRVGGGGLGVPTPPFQNHASLPPGAARVGCLLYPTTPPAGSYSLGITADSTSAVRESREDNNEATLAVNVRP